MPKLNINFNRSFSTAIVAVIFFLFGSVWILPDIVNAEYLREDAVVKAVRKVSPAVVNISSEYEVRQQANPFSDFGIDPHFDFFFRDFFDHGFERRTKRTSLGSGVIIDGKKGLILTNSHVIAQSDRIMVRLKDEREFKAEIVGADPDSDLAVLRISSEQPLPSIKMGVSSDLMIGETVIAIGNPFGFSHTVTTGVISAINRSIRTENRVYHNFIQTDASINPGNSGGPLLNINGELIGINTAIYAKAQGIGFAIPIDKAQKIISDLIQFGEVIQAWIGITVQFLDPRLARYLDLPQNQGVLIKELEKDSPAAVAGLKEGDILMAVGGRKIYSLQDYQTAIRNYADGDRVKMTLWRNGKSGTVIVKASVYPQNRAMDLAYRLLGVKVVSRSSDRHFDVSDQEKGVRISEIDQQSYLARIGVRPGDIIRQINEIKTNDIDSFEKAIIKFRQKTSVVILLQRGDRGYYITVNL